MLNKNNKIIFSSILVGLLLTGCGDSGSGDSGSLPTDNPTVTGTTGIVVDPYIVGATLFWDKNKDGIRTSDEPISSESDTNGEFIFTDIEIPEGERIVMLTKGYHGDIAYEGTLQGDLTSTGVINPLTTFKVKYPEADLVSILNSTGEVTITAEDIDKNPMDDASKTENLLTANIAIDTFIKIDEVEGLGTDGNTIPNVVKLIKSTLSTTTEADIDNGVKLANQIVKEAKKQKDLSHINKLTTDTTFFNNMKTKLKTLDDATAINVDFDFDGDGSSYNYDSQFLDNRVFSFSETPVVGKSITITLSEESSDNLSTTLVTWEVEKQPTDSNVSLTYNGLTASFTPTVVGEYIFNIKSVDGDMVSERLLKFKVKKEIIVDESKVVTAEGEEGATSEKIGFVINQMWIKSNTLTQTELEAIVANYSTLTVEDYVETNGLLVSYDPEDILAISALKKIKITKGIDAVYKKAYYGKDAFKETVTTPIDAVGGFTDGGANWHLEKINMTTAWDYTQGSTDLLMGVSDGGFDTLHTDMSGRFEGITTTVKSDHGMAVSGSMGAISDNGVAIAGINSQSKVIAGYMSMTNVQELADFSSNGKEVSVVNNSWGYALDTSFDSTNSTIANDRFVYMQWTFSEAREMLKSYPNKTFVWSAGNGIGNGLGNSLGEFGVDAKYENGAMHYQDNILNKLDNVLIVGAFDTTGMLTYYSAYGKSVDIAAPTSYTSLALNNGLYAGFNGTSAAAPVVSGVASLMYSIDPTLTGKKVKDIMIATATEYITQRQINPNGDTEYLSSPIPILDAAAAIKYVKDAVYKDVSNEVTITDIKTGEITIKYTSVDPSYVVSNIESTISSSSSEANYVAYSQPSTTGDTLVTTLDTSKDSNGLYKRYHKIISTITLHNDATNSDIVQEIEHTYSYSDIKVKTIDSQTLTEINDSELTVTSVNSSINTLFSSSETERVVFVDGEEYIVGATKTGYVEASKNIKVVENDVSLEVTLSMVQEGTTENGSVHGYVYDSEGTPIQNATIRISGGIYTGGYFATAMTDELGYYEIVGISKYATSGDFGEGTEVPSFALEVTKDGYVTQLKNEIIIITGSETEENFVLITEAVIPEEGYVQIVSGKNTINFEDSTDTTDWTFTNYINYYKDPINLWHLEDFNQTVETCNVENKYVAANLIDYSADETDKCLPMGTENMGVLWFGDRTTGSYAPESLVTSMISPDNDGVTTKSSVVGNAITPMFTLEEGKEYLLRFDTWWEIEGVNPNSQGYDILAIYVEEYDSEGNLLPEDGCSGNVLNPWNMYSSNSSDIVSNTTEYDKKIKGYSKYMKGIEKWEENEKKKWLKYEYGIKCGWLKTALNINGHLIKKLNPDVDPIVEESERIRKAFSTAGYDRKPIWVKEQIDLSEFAGKNIKLKFHFTTRDTLYNGFRGWIIDNLEVIDKAYIND